MYPRKVNDSFNYLFINATNSKRTIYTGVTILADNTPDICMELITGILETDREKKSTI